MELWIGTSGYSYGDWVGPFYPPGTPQRLMLTRYAEHFPLTELNYTFYRMPGPMDLARLANKTPANFQYVVKLHQSLSHEHDLAGAAGFRQALEPLRREGRLLATLCQYPQSFHHEPRNLERLERLADQFRDCSLAVEFRHRSWARPEVPDWLGERRTHLVSVDVPPIASLYPSGIVQSSRLIYVRLHSRHSELWYAGDKERYDYLYTDEQLAELAQSLATHRESADRALVLFNNCHRGQAAVNAQRLRELVPRLNLPLTLVLPPTTGARQQTLF